MDAAIADGRVWLSTVVLLELTAGAGTVGHRRDIRELRLAASALGRLAHPSEDDFCLAGHVLSRFATRHGAVRPRDHSHDLLVAIAAGRTRARLLTANVKDMARWARELASFGLAVRVDSIK